MLIEMRFQSKELKQEVETMVYIPTLPTSDTDLTLNIKKNYRVLYLLHGFGGDHKDWMLHTNVLRYVNRFDIALVMPSGINSFYVNTTYQKNYYDYVVNELPSVLKQTFSNLSTKKEDTFIAGLSMGGYGAVHLALLNSDKYHYAGSLAGALDIKEIFKEEAQFFQGAAQFGKEEDLEKNNYDLLKLVTKMKQNNQKFPNLYIACGKNDFIYNQTKTFTKHLEIEKIPFHYDEDEGIHDYNFWDKHIKKFIDLIK